MKLNSPSAMTGPATVGVAAADLCSGGVYDADYYLRGRQSGKSLYHQYRWLPELTVPMVKTIVKHVGIELGDTVLDFGCARGYMVRAFRELGYKAEGIDCSAWAIGNCDPAVAGHVSLGRRVEREYDWIIAKDVLEHLTPQQLPLALVDFAGQARKGFFVVVPLSAEANGPYVVPEYERDITHVQRLTLDDWVHSIAVETCDIEAVYRVPGIKDNYAAWERGNGFLTVKRLVL